MLKKLAGAGLAIVLAVILNLAISATPAEAGSYWDEGICDDGNGGWVQCCIQCEWWQFLCRCTDWP